jgi:extracellular elastinolytic metalloproteinase
MARRRPRWRNRRTGAALAAVAITLALLATQSIAQGNVPAAGTADHTPDGGAQLLGDGRPALDDLDTRDLGIAVAPTARQLDAVGAMDATVRWSSFGTPKTLIRHGDVLATGIAADTAAAAARTWLDDNRALYRLRSTDNLAVHAAVALTDEAHVVVFQQRIAGLPVSPDGFASIGLVGSPDGGWDVVYASSTFVDEQVPMISTMSLGMGDAVVAAAADAGVRVQVPDAAVSEVRNGWSVLDVQGLAHEQLVRQVAFPTLDGEARRAYETVIFDGDQLGYRYVIDAADGEVLFRESIIDADDESAWDVFPAHPPMTPLSQPPWNYPGADQRTEWCWTAQPGCKRVLENDAAQIAWDIDPLTGEPTFTTIGNAVDAAEWWLGIGAGPGQRPTSDDRSYQFPWTNSWYDSGCHPDNLTAGGNDIDASVANLFAQNWRMHTWSYHLGFTEETWNAQQHNFGINPDGEGDPVIARAQANAVSPGSRNNATMATLPDGSSSFMSMFLWQPQANAFYGPCVVGDYDMSVIGHEYTHMIENRLIGKGFSRSGFHAGALGESWADFVAMEYLNQYGMMRGSETRRWTVGGYVTGNPDRGIRNYNMAYPAAGAFPQPSVELQVGALHFGSMGYDIVGPQVHADSQIWSATNHDIRTLFLERYPSDGADHQRECADGLHPADECPGNRQWIQLVFDAMLLMPTNPTMLDARDAYFAADLMRFGGTNQDLLWQGFAQRGFGLHASVTGTQDANPVPNYESPLHEEAVLHFEAVAKEEGGQPVDAEVYVGNYEARTTAIGQTERFIPNAEGYNFVARADGYGHVRFFVDDLEPGEERTITVHMPTNVASASHGATASGDGIRHGDLIDDTEGTNWQNVFALPNLVTVDPPSAAAGTYGATGADFGPSPTPEGFAGDIVLVNDGSENPTLGCEPLIDFPAGAIALVDRGVCPFTLKVGNAQAAGAGAVIVANHLPGPPFTMAGNDPTIEIPSVMVSLADGSAIKAGLPATGTVASAPSEPVEGTQVTIAFDGEQTFSLARASAMLLPGQNRFTALRQFELYACTAGNLENPTCEGSTDAGWERFLRSDPDAFPAPNPRPSSPDLQLRSFEIPETSATHVKFVVLNNQCTGNPNYQGDQHDDPTRPTSDCRSSTVGANEVRAAALQLFTGTPQVDGASLVD